MNYTLRTLEYYDPGYDSDSLLEYRAGSNLVIRSFKIKTC